jgi:MoxR-like ATPase
VGPRLTDLQVYTNRLTTIPSTTALASVRKPLTVSDRGYNLSTMPSLPKAAAPAAAADLAARLDEAVRAVSTVLLGHDDLVRLAVAALVARGHILFEDVPGVGKTTLARALARVLGVSFARVQFTADMLPSDVLGVQVLDPKLGELHFRRGPIFAELVLADEINRASPKTQSAMLEAMAERRVTIDDTSHELPAVFTVIATQNPLEHHGAYPLPESQLDRFMVRLTLGYPPAEAELALVQRPRAPEASLAHLPQLLTSSRLAEAQAGADLVVVSDPVARYLLALVQATREHADVVVGGSPRASMAFATLARAWAFVHGRDFVLPDDVRELAPVVLAHRLVVAGSTGAPAREAARAVIDDALARLPVPR